MYYPTKGQFPKANWLVETLPHRFLERNRKQSLWVPQATLFAETAEAKPQGFTFDWRMDLLSSWYIP
jgi:hypothetical protein